MKVSDTKRDVVTRLRHLRIVLGSFSNFRLPNRLLGQSIFLLFDTATGKMRTADLGSTKVIHFP